MKGEQTVVQPAPTQPTRLRAKTEGACHVGEAPGEFRRDDGGTREDATRVVFPRRLKGSQNSLHSLRPRLCWEWFIYIPTLCDYIRYVNQTRRR